MFNLECLYNPYVKRSETSHKRTQQEGLHGKIMISKVEGRCDDNRSGNVPYNQW